MLSLEDGAPDFASIDNAEMIAGVKDEYEGHASAFADATNVFVPLYRQSGLKHEEDCWKICVLKLCRPSRCSC